MSSIGRRRRGLNLIEQLGSFRLRYVGIAERQRTGKNPQSKRHCRHIGLLSVGSPRLGAKLESNLNKRRLDEDNLKYPIPARPHFQERHLGTFGASVRNFDSRECSIVTYQIVLNYAAGDIVEGNSPAAQFRGDVLKGE